MAARRSTIDLVTLVRRRFFRSTLQPIAEHLEYNPASIAARYRANYLGSISLPAVQQASYSTSQSDKPTRETGDDKLDDVPANQNTVPEKGSLDKQGGGQAMKVRQLSPDALRIGVQDGAWGRRTWMSSSECVCTPWHLPSLALLVYSRLLWERVSGPAGQDRRSVARSSCIVLYVGITWPSIGPSI